MEPLNGVRFVEIEDSSREGLGKGGCVDDAGEEMKGVGLVVNSI